MKKKVISYLIEIVTIFIGITLSFVFEDYRQARNERNNRKEIVKSLIIDIDFKKREIKEDLNAIEWQYKTIDSCLWFARQGKKAPLRLLSDLYSVMNADYSHFEASTPTFLTLTSTGVWQQFPDSLRRRIYNSFNHDFIYLNTMYKKAAEYSSFIQEHYLVADALMKPLEEEPDDELGNRALADKKFRSALLLFRNQNYNTIDRLNVTFDRLEQLSNSLKEFKD
ncbi:MAG TPA: hypothetical protein VL728_14030 [Cyclobacteriaceae bacterium]|nr:hypothetical protein [Cyclobacteriaceae bacterium]